MTTRLAFGRDVQGYNAFAPAFADDAFSATLAATTDTTVTIPSNFQNWIAFFSVEPSKLVWVALNTAAAAPAGATFASTASELISSNFQYPPARKVKAGDVLHFFSQAGTANVGVTLYAIEQ